MKRAVTLLSLVACATALASCGGGTSATSAVPSAASAYVRFANVSPDAGASNPLNPSLENLIFDQYSIAQVLVDGGVVASLPGDTALRQTPPTQPSITGYIAVASGQHAIAYRGSSGSLTYQTTTLAPGSYTTIVLSGSFCLGTLAFHQFDDPKSASGRITIYNVAPDAAPKSVEFGYITQKDGVTHSLGNVAANSRGEGPVAGQGIAGYVGSGAALLVKPSDAESFDTNDAVPFNALTTLSLFYRDGVPTNQGSLVCSTETPTAPLLQGVMSN